ncbi:MAG: two-component system, chemotaxis family, CheB/CheR fusion protein [Chthoniobacter sp.]|nr:two-component system, chemotaxis family, CheB/CheR fusion protein [Chthoniobacter sp.]
MARQPSPRSGRAAPAKIERKGRAPKAAPKPADETAPLGVVGIGGSAGGFESLMQVLGELTENTGLAFVVLQHLDPNHVSHLADLASRATHMPVAEIQDGVTIKPDSVYVLPPNAEVRLDGDQLRLTSRSKERIHMPIDRFFRSLAAAKKNRAIGIVLSGTGSDGTVGLGFIKSEGGIALAEAEATAKHYGMPGSALASGCVDASLTPAQIARELVAISRHPYLRFEPESLSDDGAPVAAAQHPLAKIFQVLRQHTGVDFSHYKVNTLQRRITRRLMLHRLERTDDYLKFLRGNTDEIEALFNDLLINVTHFFRDDGAYTALKKRIIPHLIKNRLTQGGDLRIWVPGCATGEEVYSLAMTIMEVLGRNQDALRVQIFGTDLADSALAKARMGVYSESQVKEISPARLRRFFSRAEGRFTVNRNLRDMCTFARQNICEDPPFSRLDLISCRNVLIYLGPELQKRCFPIFHYALHPDGYLMLGTSETVGAFSDLFALVDKRFKIYSKRVTTVRPEVDFRQSVVAPIGQPKAAIPAQREHDLTAEICRQADRVIVNRTAPGGVIIDAHLQVVQFRGATGSFLEHVSGDPSWNILQMVRPSLAIDLRASIYTALKQDMAMRKEDVAIDQNGQTKFFDIELLPFRAGPKGDRYLMLLFHARAKTTSLTGSEAQDEGGTPSGGRRRAHEERLREELRATKESLQAIIEEQEATNEELKSANEEIESSNEELQSTNEELETAKEELQSSNEELQTLNEELGVRNAEMSTINNDLNNLLFSINIPIVMVDNALAIRRITPLAERLFNLISSDLGRRLTDLRPNINIPDIEQLIRQVIETLEPREREVQDRDGHWFAVRIRPYRTHENKIDGAVVTLVDIDASKRSATSRQLATEYVAALADAIADPVLILDSELRVRKANQAFLKVFRQKKKPIEGVKVFEIVKVPKLEALLSERVPKVTELRDVPLAPAALPKGVQSMMLNARWVNCDGAALTILSFHSMNRQQE